MGGSGAKQGARRERGRAGAGTLGGARAVGAGLVAFLLLCSAPSTPAWAQDGGPAGEGRAEALEVVRRLAAALRERSLLPGLAVAVGEGDGIVLSEAWGVADLGTRAPATPLTRWRIGSVGKGLTAVGAVLLAERGRLDLDRPVAELLPSRELAAGRATARQLAGHLGGVRHYREGEGISHVHYDDVLDALELFAGDSLVAPPGTEYSYSTYGYTLLSAVMQRAAGEPFLDWMQRNVFEPLGMRHTGPDLANRVVPGRASFYQIRVVGELMPAPFTDNSYKWAGGGLLSTPEDLVRFGIGLLGGDLLGRDGVEALFTSQRTDAGEETGYGMGFRPGFDGEGRRVVHHGGSSEGGRAFLLLYPGEGVVVAMAANRATAPLFEEEAQSMAHFVLDHGPSGDGGVDRELAGTWPIDGTLGDDPVEGSLRLYARGLMRGILEWDQAQWPIEIVAVDRHGDRLLVFGVGAHGVMTMELEETAGGWAGRWDYLGREGEIRVAGDGAGR